MSLRDMRRAAPQLLFRLRYRLSSAVAAALELARGQAAPDADAERALEDFDTGAPPPLRAMRMAAVLAPVVAVLLLGIQLAYEPLFAFTSADALRLTAIMVLGSALAVLCYTRPSISAAAFLALWNLKPLALAVYAGLLFLPPAFFDSIFLKRVYCGIIMLPFVGAMWILFRSHPHRNVLARAFPLIFAVMAAAPGFILPPYYQGIAGWTTVIEDTDTVTLAGYQLVNDEGERIWLTHTIFTPVTQVGRFDFAWYFKKDAIGPIEPFLYKAYQRAYPWLKDGYMPNQRFLGHFAYPPSTYAVNLPDHTDFPPERIRNVQRVYMIFDRQDQLIDTQIYDDFVVPRP